MLSPVRRSALLLPVVAALFALLLVGCDATGAEPDERGRFTATFDGAATAAFGGEAVHDRVEGALLLGALTNFSVRLTDRDWSRTRRAVYLVRRDPATPRPGTYPLLDLSAQRPAPLASSRMWAYVSGAGEDTAYSLGGELRIEEASGDRLTGTFRFPAAPLSDTTQATTVWVEGSFVSLRR
jgi:hypothetical protein